MVDKPTSDLIMYFVDEDGNDVAAECQLTVTVGDNYMLDFKPFRNARMPGNYFEIADFNFGVKLVPTDKNTGGISKTSSTGNGGASSATATGRVTPPGMNPAGGEFYAWRSAQNDAYEKMTFPIEFNKFSFTRLIDCASPTFFMACCNQKTFQKAVLVKRIAVSAGLQSVQQMAYVRVEFKDVMITTFGWTDGDVVSEQCEFICKAMRVFYRQQMADGTLGKEAPKAIWDQNKNSGGDNANAE